MPLKQPFATTFIAVAALLASTFTGESARAAVPPAPAATVTSFVFKTTVDASSVGGSSTTPLRITVQFSPDLAPGSGPFGSSGDGTFESYGPLNHYIIEVAGQCAGMSGAGTGATVFNNAGPNEDSFDARADGQALAGKTLFGRTIRLTRFLLVDSSGTMFDSTALPTSAAFADASDFQQTLVELVNADGSRTRLQATDAPYQLFDFDPQADIAAIIDDVNAAPVTTALKSKLNEPLQRAGALVGGLLIQKNLVKARGELEDFIKLVRTNRNKIGNPAAADLMANAGAIIAELPACTG